VSKNLLSFIPLPNTTGPQGEGRLITSALAPVHINQSTIDMRHSMGKNDDLHGYYAFQADLRTAANAQGNTVPDFGDQRGGHRQIVTVNETHVFSQALVNEARVGYNHSASISTPMWSSTRRSRHQRRRPGPERCRRSRSSSA
jgi:hypothetical protein